ncbi:mucin-17-like [Schistocerca serialis cubense]|uniref:mucin-17-like n=1 Tax=Schistocerca serialis cubense TaxID=2023355 RepID=UPI00214F5AEB|nr:mucin-17-like [Schistocerca serialis cubense]
MKTLVLLGAVLAAAFARPGGMAKDARSPCSPKRGTSGAVILKDRIGAVVQKVDAALVNTESVRSETAGTEMSNLSPYHEKLDSSSESKLNANHKTGFASGGRVPSPRFPATPSALKDAASLEETYSSETSNPSLHPEKPDSSSETTLNANRKIGVASGGRLPSASSNSPSLMSSTPKTAASLEGTDSSETSNTSPSAEKSDSSSESSLNANRKVYLASGEKLPSASSRAPSETSSTPKTAASVEDIDSSKKANSSPSTGKPDSSSESKLSPSHKIDLATGGKLPSAGYNSPSEMSSTSKNAASLRNTDSSETSDLSPYPEKPDGSSESNLNTSHKTGLAVGGKLPSARSNSPSVMSSTPKTAASLEVTDSSETSNSSPSDEKSGSSSESTLNANRKVDLASGDKLPSASSRTPSETSSTPKTAASLQDADSSETSNSAPSFERPCSPSESMVDDNSSSDLSSGGKLPLPGAVCPPPKSPSVSNTNNLSKFQASDVSQSDYKAKDDLPASNDFQNYPLSNLLATSSVKTQESVFKSLDNIASIESSTASLNNPRADSPDSTSFGDLPVGNVPQSPSAHPHADSSPAVSPRYPTSHFVPAAPATTVLNLKDAYNFWPYSRLLYNHPANTFIVSVPLTAMCSLPSSNSAMSGLPISSPFADLPGHRFSPDVTAVSSNIMDAVQGAVLANWPSNNAVIPQQLSLDGFSKVGGVYNAEDPEDAVDADVDALPCAAIGPVAEPLRLPADTISSSAPSSSAPNTFTFGGVPVRIWAPPAGPSTSQIAGIINFGSFPLPTAVKQAAAPVNAVQNTINFGGMSVRSLDQPVTVPLSVTSNIISVGGWPVVVLCALLAAALARPGVLLEAAPSPCSTKAGAAGAVTLRDRVGAIMEKEDALSVSNESTHSEAASSETSSLPPSPKKPNSSPGSNLNTYRNIGLTFGSKMPSLGSMSPSQTLPDSKDAVSIQDTDSSETSKLSPIAKKPDSSPESKLNPNRKTGLASGSKLPSSGSLSLSQKSSESVDAVSLQDTDSSEKSNLSPFAKKPDSSSESKLNASRKIGLASGSKVPIAYSIRPSQTLSQSKNTASLQDTDSSERSNQSPSQEEPDSSSESKLNPNPSSPNKAIFDIPISNPFPVLCTEDRFLSDIIVVCRKDVDTTQGELLADSPSNCAMTPQQLSLDQLSKMVLSAVLAAAIARPGGMSEVEPLPCSTKTRESGAVILKDRIGTNMQAEDATLVSSESAEAETASYERTSLSPSTETPDTPTVTSLNINRKIDLASSSKMPSTGSIISSQVSSAPTNVASLHHTDSSEISGSAPSAERLDSSTEIKLKASTKIALTTGGQVPSDSSISQSQTSPAPENAASLQHTDSSETFNPSPSAEKADCSPESMLKTDSKVGLASGSKVLSPGSISLSQTTSAPKNAASVQDIDSSEMSNSPSAKRPSSSTESNLNANSKIALAAAGQVPSGGSISRSQTSSVPKNPASLQDTDSSEVSISSPSAEKADCSPESMSNTSHKVDLASGGKAPSTGSISHTQTSSAPKSAPGLQDIDSSETSNSSPSAERPNSSSESKLNAISTLALASGGQAPSTGSISQYEMASPPKNAASLQDIDSSETSNLPPSAEGPCSSSESVLDDNSPVNLSSARKIHSPDSVSPSVRSPSLNNVERVPDLETSGVSEPVQRLSDDLPASNTFQNLPVSNLRATSSVNSQASVSESLDNIASVDMPEAFQPVKTPKTDSLASSSFGDLPTSNIPASPSADSQEEISPASDPRYPISSLAPTSTGLGLYNAVNHWLCTRPFYSPPANSDSVSLPFTMTYPTPNSNKGKFGLSMSWPFTGLSVESFSPDIFAHSSNVIDTAHCASLADGLANFTPTLRQLSLDECNKVGAFLTTSDRADAGYIPGAPVYTVVGPSAAAVRLSAGTGTSAAPRSQSSNTVVFGGVPIRVWAPPAAPPKSQYPSSINFDGIPVSTAVQQAAVPVNPAYNIFNFGGVPVRTVGRSAAGPLSVTSNTVNFYGRTARPVFLLSAVLAAAYARPAVLSEAAPSPCSTKTGATSAAILNDRIGAVMQKGDAAPVSSESAQSRTASSETPSLSSSAKKPNSSPESKLNPNSNIGPNLDRKTPSSDSISPSQMSPQSKKAASHQDIDSSETSNLFPSRETHDSSLEIKLNGNSKVEPISASKMLPPDSISPSRTSPKSKNVIRLQNTDSYETSNLSPYPEKPASSPESKLNPNRKLGLISGSKMPSPASVSQSQTSSASKDIDSSETPNSSPSAVTPESSTESKLNANRKTALASGGQVPSGGSISQSQTSLVPKNGATLQDIDSSETSISSPSAEKADCSPESMSNTNYMVGLTSGSKVLSTGSISPSETSAAPKNAASFQDIDSSETSKPFPSTERPCSSSESMLDDSSENLSSAGKMPSPNSFTPSERSPSLTNANSDQEFETSGVSDSAQKPNDDLPDSNIFQNSPVSNLRDTSSVNPQESVSKSLGNIARVDTSATLQPTNKAKADSPDSTSFGDLAGSNFPSSHSADSQDDLSPASDPRYLINSLVPSASATPGLGLHHAAGYWLCSGPFNRHQDDSDSVNLPVTMTYPPPSSNKAMFGLSTSTPLADLSGDIFSPDGIAHSSNVMDNAGGAVLTDRPASFTPTLQQLSLDELSKVGAVLAAEDPAAVAHAADTPAFAVVGPSAASVEQCAGTAYSSAPQIQTPNTVTFGGVPVRVWVPPAAPSTTQYPRIINFGGVPVPANVQEAGAAHNTINFGGVPVRTLSHPVTVPLSVISNINFSGWPVLPVVNSLLHQ